MPELPRGEESIPLGDFPSTSQAISPLFNKKVVILNFLKFVQELILYPLTGFVSSEFGRCPKSRDTTYEATVTSCQIIMTDEETLY